MYVLFLPFFCQSLLSNLCSFSLSFFFVGKVCNENIPYSDTFFVSCRFCLTRVAHNKTRFLVTANINFKKKCWGMVQSECPLSVGANRVVPMDV